MIYETLDDGTILTEELAEKLVCDVYAALEKGAYKVAPNPHKNPLPVKLTDQRRDELLQALSHAETAEEQAFIESMIRPMEGEV